MNYRFEETILSSHDRAKATLLTATLEAAVPLRILDFKAQEGPQEWDWNRARDFGHVLAERGDSLLFRTPGKTAELMAGLIHAVAVLAFLPGGVRLFGLHFEAVNEA